jgi:hypothetical protein
VLFYTLVHFGQAGYVLTFLPALVVLLAHALVESLAAGSKRLRRPHWRFALTCSALVAVVFLNTAFFVSARPIPLDFSKPEAEGWKFKPRGELHQWIMSRTAAALREHEAVIRTYVESIRLMCDPDNTVLITELGNRRSYPWLRHAMFYLPEYPIYQLSLTPAPLGFYAPQSAATMILTPGSRITLPRRVRQLVWFVDHWDPSEPRPPGLREIALPYGRYLYVLPVGPIDAVYAGYTFRHEPFTGRW